MHIIEVTTGIPAGFDTFVWIMAGLAVLVIVGAIVWSIVGRKNRIGEGILGLLAVFCMFILLGQGFVTAVDDEDRIRIQQEVSSVVGRDVSPQEVEKMLDNEPVRDVYYSYNKDENVLIVEVAE